MTVDKFGNYHSQKYNLDTLKKNVANTLGIIVDRNNNLNIQHKKIKNLGPPTEGTDAINQSYLSLQINHTQEVLKKGISKEVISIRSDIEELRHTIKDIFDVIKEISSAIYGKTSNNR